MSLPPQCSHWPNVQSGSAHPPQVSLGSACTCINIMPVPLHSITPKSWGWDWNLNPSHQFQFRSPPTPKCRNAPVKVNSPNGTCHSHSLPTHLANCHHQPRLTSAQQSLESYHTNKKGTHACLPTRRLGMGPPRQFGHHHHLSSSSCLTGNGHLGLLSLGMPPEGLPTTAHSWSQAGKAQPGHFHTTYLGLPAPKYQQNNLPKPPKRMQCGCRVRNVTNVQ